MRSAILSLGLLFALAIASPARADEPVFAVMNTSETPPDGVWFRYGPDAAQTTRTTGVGVYMNEHVRVKCFWHGTPFGAYDNDVWYFAYDQERPTAAGRPNQGWINTHYVDDGQTADHPHPAVSACATGSGDGGTVGGAVAPVSTPAAPIVNGFYNRGNAVKWALAHAKDGQRHSAMCTWFVSNALWGGSFPKSTTWTDQGRYGTTAHGTKAEWLVDDFLKYIQSRYSTALTEITPALTTNAVPAAQPGDIIVYDWGQGHGRSHLSFVVNIASGQYPEVSEMGQFSLNVAQAGLLLLKSKSSGYTKRGWTWSAVNRTWLQKNNPKMRAWLLHINGGVFLPEF